jgi:TonB family protein
MALLLIGFVPGTILAQGFKVIANPSVQAESVSATDLKGVFLEQQSSLGSAHVSPVLAKGGPAHEAFLSRLLGRSEADLQNYYRTLVFTGRGSMPRALDSDADVIEYVARTRGAIGYVSPDAATHGVRALDVVSGGNAMNRKLVYRVEPEYPEVLKKRFIGGTVKLRVVIALSGNVQDVTVIGGDAVLGESAAAAVTKWKYAAASTQTTAEVSLTFDPRR